MRIVDNPNQPQAQQLEPIENKEVVNENGNKSKKFNDNEIDFILETLALQSGKSTTTSRILEQDYKIQIHPATLDRWKNEYYPSRYAEMQRNLADKLSTQLTGKITDVANQSITIQQRLQQEMDEKLDTESIDLKDLPSAIRNMAQASEISIRQRQLLEDKPTEIIEVKSIEQVISDLEEDEIIVDADVVDEQDITDEKDSSFIALPI